MNSRLKYFKQLLAKQNFDALLISVPANIIYLTSYAGFSKVEREAFLLITPKAQYIITDARYSDAVREHIPGFTLIERAVSIKQTLQELFTKQKIQSLGFEDGNITVKEYVLLSSLLTHLKPVDLEQVRILKTEEEVRKMQRACDIGDKAFTYIQIKIKIGMTERELALELELFIRKNSGELSFPTIVAFGKNSAVPHHHTSDQRLMTNDIILLDFGVMYENYCSDMSRTLFMGSPTEEQKKVYQIVLDSQKKAIKYLQISLEQIPDTEPKASEVDKAAREYIISKGYPSIPHSLGHGIGLDVHEAPTLSPKSEQILTDSMVFSIEPGIYLSGKFGVRIEDLFTITNGRLIQLTKATNSLIRL